MFLQVSVILFTGGGPGPGGCLVPGGACLGGGAWSRGVWSWEGLLPGVVPAQGGACDRGCLLWGVSDGDPPDCYCCGRYASYWNAFLFEEKVRCIPPCYKKSRDMNQRSPNSGYSICICIYLTYTVIPK